MVARGSGTPAGRAGSATVLAEPAAASGAVLTSVPAVTAPASAVPGLPATIRAGRRSAVAIPAAATPAGAKPAGGRSAVAPPYPADLGAMARVALGRLDKTLTGFLVRVRVALRARRLAQVALALVLAFTLGITVSPVSLPEALASQAPYAQENAMVAGRALPELLAGSGDAAPAAVAWPAFATVMGYEPATARLPGDAEGTTRAVKPAGSCSSPIGATVFDFSAACKAHDLGYDLLRYGERTRQPAGPAARQRLDAQFERDLHAHCAATTTGGLERLGCDGLASLYAGVAKANSWRQRYGVP